MVCARVCVCLSTGSRESSQPPDNLKPKSNVVSVHASVRARALTRLSPSTLISYVPPRRAHDVMHICERKYMHANLSAFALACACHIRVASSITADGEGGLFSGQR